VLVTLESGSPLTGYSYVDQWVRITDDSGRSGWVYQSLVGRRQ
jgi:SH3-like domain-containing protein